jgi:parallel beta-helix repeat protein
MPRIAYAGGIVAVVVASGACSSSSGGGSSLPAGFASSSALCTGTGRCIAIDSTAKETDISAAFASTKTGDVIAFGPGTYAFRNQLALGSASGVTVIGSGQGQTILDFGGQVAAEDGIYAANTSNLVFEGFTIENTPGNGIKTLQVTGVTFRNLEVTWLGLNSTDGGGAADWDSGPDGAPPPAGISDGPYGIYPVQSKNVLIDHCSISGASDSGIYVGQSQEIVVRNSEAFANVAGIEIENSTFADVYGNYAHDNTAGILVFALPGLQEEGGHDIRVFSNDISSNDRPNFARNGDIVGLVPAGTGFFVMANHNVEVFQNDIEGNGTAGAGIISYFLPGLLMPEMDPNYYEYPSNVYVHDNVYVGNGTSPDTTGPTSGQIGQIVASGITAYPGMRMPDVSYDGVVDPAKASATNPNPMQVCVHEAATTTFCDGHYDKLDLLALEAGMSNEAAITTCDVSPFACTLPSLPAVTFPGLTP